MIPSAGVEKQFYFESFANQARAREAEAVTIPSADIHGLLSIVEIRAQSMGAIALALHAAVRPMVNEYKPATVLSYAVFDGLMQIAFNTAAMASNVAA